MARAPINAVAGTIDNAKMTALSAWAVHELGHAGADRVEISWTFGDPEIAVEASFFGEGVYSARSEGIRRRDRAVMAAVSDLLDVRADAANARQRRPGSEPWWQVLGLSPDADRQTIETAHRSLALTAHPDRGGRGEDMSRINVARDAALQALLN